jgi:hypothetical protein
MEQLKAWKMKWPVVLIAMLMLAAFSACSSLPQSSSISTPSETIAVSGIGEATGLPDEATVQLGVNITADNVNEAVDQANATIDAITAAVLGFGIEAKDVQTTNFSVWTEQNFEFSPEGQTGEPRYRVDSTIQVRIAGVENASQVIGAALEAGANNVYGLTFGLSDPSELESTARADAIQDARARADQLAAELGLQVGEVLSVSEISGSVIPPFFGYGLDTAEVGLGGGAAPPVSPGELTVSVTVNMVYRLVR